jgi:hypothetical protein
MKMLLIVMLFVSACGSVPEQVSFETQQAAAVEDPNSDNHAKMEEARLERQLLRDASERQAAIDGLQQAFLPVSTWEGAIRDNQAKVCVLDESVERMSNALYWARVKKVWEHPDAELISEEEAQSALQKASLEFVAELVRILRLPISQRVEMGSCGVSEGWFELVDTGAIGNRVINALKQSGYEPKDAGLSPEEIRALLEKDYIKRAAHLRKEVLEGKISGLAGEGLRVSLLKEAEEWGFAPEKPSK